MNFKFKHCVVNITMFYDELIMLKQITNNVEIIGKAEIIASILNYHTNNSVDIPARSVYANIFHGCAAECHNSAVKRLAPGSGTNCRQTKNKNACSYMARGRINAAFY